VDDVWVAGIAVAAGLGVVLAGPSPTGSTVVDVVLIVAAVAVCISMIATAPWTRNWRGSKRPIVAAALLGVGVQVLARLGNKWHFGCSSVLAVAPVVLLTLLAVQRRSGHRRVRLWSVVGGFVAIGLLALLGFGVAAAAARPNLTRGTDEARQALRSLETGDFATAQQGFQLAAGLLGGAGDDLSAPWAQPARLIPVVAQHRRVAADLARSAESVSSAIADVLDDIDFDQLRVVNGAIDIDAIAALQEPLAELNASLADLHATVDSVDSPWLVGPIRDRLATLNSQIEHQQAEGDRAALAVERAPEMLGANGKRVYFIAFTTPAEARGLGGFMGNWAEVTMDAGQISVTGFGRTADLVMDGDTEHWGRITSSPHFPDVATLIADGYPAYSGHQIDGVFAMDVYTLAGLMKLTGPIGLVSLPQTVTADNVATFLLNEQYALAQNRADRIDMLEEVAGTTLSRLLTGSLPAPPDLVKLLSPFAAQGRLLGWSADPDEEALFERMRISGELPALNGGDGLVIALDNVANNKIDYYLTGEVTYNVGTDPASGTAGATLDITLHNGAPGGLIEPAIVFGNSVGAPTGSSVMELSVYSAMTVTGMTVDGQSRTADRTSIEHDFKVSTVRVATSAASTTQIHVQLAGPLDLTNGYHLIIRNGASVSPMGMNLVVDETVAEDLGSAAGIHRIGPDGHDG
jgi:type II secretory pathway pseudopilin PulG